MKIRAVGAEWFHADRRTDRHYEDKSLFAILRTRLKNLHLFFKTPRPHLGPKQPIQWVPDVSLLEGQSGRSVRLTTRLYRVPRTRTMDLYIHTLYMPSWRV